MKRDLSGEDGDNGRRALLKSMAAVSAGLALPGSAAGAQSSLDAYHRTLRNDLTEGQGVPEGEFVYGTSEEAALDGFALSREDADDG